MKRYSLFSKNSNEAINSIKSSTLEGAIIFFASSKTIRFRKI
jgi:hypothetical protein